MSKIKSNPVVFPFLEFKNLSNKNFTAVFLEKKIINWDDILNIISNLYFKIPKTKGKTLEEKILNVFLHKSFLFGPKEYILDYKDYWLDKIRYFTQNEEKIKFTILGFPFKAPLLLKTTRICPDLGDVLVLNQLKNIVTSIEKIYHIGAEIYIVTEGCFGKLNKVPKKNVILYQKFLKLMIEKLNFGKFIKILPLDKLESYSNFKKIFNKNLKYYKQLYKNQDKEFIKKYNLAYPSIYHIVNPEVKNVKILMDVYNTNLSSMNLPKIKKIRERIKKDTHNAILKYFSYLKTRDDLNFLDNEIKGALALSVSPKPKRIGVLPINKLIKKLPHHGVTVYNSKKNFFNIEYYIDLLRSNKKYQPVYLQGDFDNQPFFYISI